MIRQRAHRRGFLVLAAAVVLAMGAGPEPPHATTAAVTERVAAEEALDREAGLLAAARLRSGYALAVG